MKKLTINTDLKVIDISIIVFTALEALGIDTKDITVAELYNIKQGLFSGINKVNEDRKPLRGSGVGVSGGMDGKVRRSCDL